MEEYQEAQIFSDNRVENWRGTDRQAEKEEEEEEGGGT
jgi:hypothetical protein